MMELQRVGRCPGDRRPRGPTPAARGSGICGGPCADGKETRRDEIGDFFFCAHDGIASWVGEFKTWGSQISYSNAYIMGKILSASNANIMGWREYLVGFT